MNRRSFVQRLGLGAAATSLGCAWRAASSPPLSASPSSSPSAAPRRLGRIGLELYTVRQDLARDPERTLAAVAAIGYQDAEVVWPLLRQAPNEFRAMLDRAGLRAPSGHIAASWIVDDWVRRLDDGRVMGHEYLFVASLPSESSRTLDDWRRWADRFNTAARTARAHDLWLGFHTEPEHFRPIDGQVPYDVFVERLDPALTRLQLDIGNAAMGGADPMAYLTRWRDRYWSFHVKDVPVIGQERDTELGRGVLDVAGMLRAAGDLSRKVVYVEQEGSADPLESARRDYQYLRGLAL